MITLLCETTSTLISVQPHDIKIVFVLDGAWWVVVVVVVVMVVGGGWWWEPNLLHSDLIHKGWCEVYP